MFSKRYVVSIVEQPAKTHRFRYASEIDATRSAGSIAGANDRPPNNRTYPTIRVEGYSGPMLVMLCLLNPHDKLVHPHAITGKEEKNKRYFKAGAMFVYTNGPEVIFNKIGILCVRTKSRTDIEAALRLREDLNIDPFRKGFPHMQKHELINLDAVRLCFNVFLPTQDLTGDDRFNLRMYTQPLDAVLSDVIYDVKKVNDLKIVELIECSGSMRGGTKIVLLCKKYNKDPPPEVVFAEPDWEANAQILRDHKQVALVFLTPPYRDPKCSQPVEVEVYLRTTNAEGDNFSDPVKFTYIPEQRAKKRPPSDYLSSIIQKKTLLEEYFGGRVPYPRPAPRQFFEMPPCKQEFIGASPSSYAAQPQAPDSWPQPSTSSNLHFLPQPADSSNNDTHTTKENVTQKQRVNEPTHQNSTVNYVGSEIDNNIFSVSPDYSQQAETAFDVDSFFQSNCNTLQDTLLQNSVAVKPNVVPDNLIHYDQTPDVISDTNGVIDDFFHDEDLVHLCNALVDVRNQNPFVSDSDAEMLSGELKNLSC